MSTERNRTIDDRQDEELNAGAEGAEDTAEHDDIGDIEAVARRAGWRPRSEWKGKPEDWTDAATFVDRGFKNSAMSRERYLKLDRRFAASQNEVTQLKGNVEKLSKDVTEAAELIRGMHEQTTAAAKRAYERALAEATKRHDQAVRDSDPDAAREALNEIREIEAAKPEPKPAKNDRQDKDDEDRGDKGKDRRADQTPPTYDPAIVAFVDRNPWYNEDEVANAAATTIHGRLKKQHPEWSLEKNLQEVEKEMAKRFPEHFEGRDDIFDDEEDEEDRTAKNDRQPRRKSQEDRDRREDPPRVSRPRDSAAGDRGPRRGEKRFEDLPQEAQAQFHSLKKVLEAQGKKKDPKYEYTKEKYMQDYQW